MRYKSKNLWILIAFQCRGESAESLSWLFHKFLMLFLLVEWVCHHFYMWFHLVLTTVLELELCIDLADNYPNPGLFVRVIFIHTIIFLLFIWRVTQSTYWVEDYSEEKFTSLNTLVQLFRTSWIFFVEDCVGEKPTGLSWKNLKKEWTSKVKVSFNQLISWNLYFFPHEKWCTSWCHYSTLN